MEGFESSPILSRLETETEQSAAATIDGLKLNLLQVNTDRLCLEADNKALRDVNIKLIKKLSTSLDLQLVLIKNEKRQKEIISAVNKALKDVTTKLTDELNSSQDLQEMKEFIIEMGKWEEDRIKLLRENEALSEKFLIAEQKIKDLEREFKESREASPLLADQDISTLQERLYFDTEETNRLLAEALGKQDEQANKVKDQEIATLQDKLYFHTEETKRLLFEKDTTWIEELDYWQGEWKNILEEEMHKHQRFLEERSRVTEENEHLRYQLGLIKTIWADEKQAFEDKMKAREEAPLAKLEEEEEAKYRKDQEITTLQERLDFQTDETKKLLFEKDEAWKKEIDQRETQWKKMWEKMLLSRVKRVGVRETMASEWLKRVEELEKKVKDGLIEVEEREKMVEERELEIRWRQTAGRKGWRRTTGR